MFDKQSRADLVFAYLCQLNPEQWTTIPAQMRISVLRPGEGWSVKRYHDHRAGPGRGYKQMAELRFFPAKGWDHLVLNWRGKDVFVANCKGSRVDVLGFKPGDWERRFGADAGADTVPHMYWDDPIGPLADEQLKARVDDMAKAAARTAPEVPAGKGNPVPSRPAQPKGPYSLSVG